MIRLRKKHLQSTFPRQDLGQSVRPGRHSLLAERNEAITIAILDLRCIYGRIIPFRSSGCAFFQQNFLGTYMERLTIS